jgi:ketosteroid isomerase-like protein
MKSITKSIASALAVFLLAITAAIAQVGSQDADHVALRKLKDDLLTAINNRNLTDVDAMLHKPFLSTVITQESFNETGKLRSWFDDIFSRPLLRLRHFRIQAEADEMAQIYTGTFAVARGSTKERYELADGRGFDFDGRWTATAIKENGQWKVLAIHAGTNFLDNPVINAVERNTMTFAAVGALAGVVIGFLLGFFIRRKQAKAA